jgi:hypothetical protein
MPKDYKMSSFWHLLINWPKPDRGIGASASAVKSPIASAKPDYKAMMEAHFADANGTEIIRKAMAALTPAERALILWSLERFVSVFRDEIRGRS